MEMALSRYILSTATWSILFGLLSAQFLPAQNPFTENTAAVHTLVVDVDSKACLIIPGHQPLADPEKVRAYFRDEFQKLKANSEKDKGQRVEPLLLMRCDPECRFGDLRRLMEIATDAGFRHTQLRVVFRTKT